MPGLVALVAGWVMALAAVPHGHDLRASSAYGLVVGAAVVVATTAIPLVIAGAPGRGRAVVVARCLAALAVIGALAVGRQGPWQAAVAGLAATVFLLAPARQAGRPQAPSSAVVFGAAAVAAAVAWAASRAPSVGLLPVLAPPAAIVLYAVALHPLAARRPYGRVQSVGNTTPSSAARTATSSGKTLRNT